MRSQTSAALAASLVGVAAASFQDTSPFLAVLPSSISTDHLSSKHFVSAARIDALVDDTARTCPTSSYVVVSQPDSSAEEHATWQQHLARRTWPSTKDAPPTKLFIPEVVGFVNADEMAATIHNACGGTMTRVNGSDGTVPTWNGNREVVRLEFPAATKYQGEDRRKALAMHGAMLNAVLSSLEEQGDVSVLFTTTPAHSLSPGSTEGASGNGHMRSHVGHIQHPMQVVDFDVEDGADDAVHVAWKRDTEGHIPAHLRRRQESGNGTNSNAGLFERYNYLSAGIFMGLIAFILLFSILLVGMNAVASVEVSEGSFNKEMVNAMTKAQKQQ